MQLSSNEVRGRSSWTFLTSINRAVYKYVDASGSLWCACADPRAAPYASHHSFCTFTCSDIIYGHSDEAFSIDIFRNSHCARRMIIVMGSHHPTVHRSSVSYHYYSPSLPHFYYTAFWNREARVRRHEYKYSSVVPISLQVTTGVSVCIGSNVGVSEGRTNIYVNCIRIHIHIRWSVESVFTTNVATRSR